MDDALTTTLTWERDVLDGFEASRLPSVEAPGGSQVARTLVRRAQQPSAPRAIVLHVHGRNDYFFHTHVAGAFAEADCAFYAVDMRRAGRSLTAGEQPHHIRSITELTRDIADAAAAAIADIDGGENLPLIVHAHSTGALAAALWAADQPHPQLAGLILNGPLFGLRLRSWKKWGMHAMPSVARVTPEKVILPAHSAYSVHIYAGNGGEWEFDPAWKRPGGEPVTAGWLAATHLARKRVARGLDIRVPVLVARSAHSGPDVAENPLLLEQDTVVDVDAIARVAGSLGSHVEQLVIDGALHDLSLSAEGPRRQYLDAVRAWVATVVS